MPKLPQPNAELALIAQIRSRFPQTPTKTLIEGIGDDCAILCPPPNHDLLVTTDFTLEGRHFLRATHPANSVGHRTLARGLSDLAAMGATPLAAFLSLALPANLPRTPAGRRWIAAFLDGLKTLAAEANVPLAGGDTSQSPTDLILADILLLGSAPHGKALRRSTACPGDSLYVTGTLGGAAAELRTVLARISPPRITSTESHPHLYPQPRLAVGKALRNKATACIDLSDGLATDLAHLCEASNLHAELDSTALPLHPKATLDDALHGGEDYELLFAASARIPHTLAGIPITRIGRLLKPSPRHPTVTLGDAPLKPAPTTSPDAVTLESMRQSTRIIRSTITPALPGTPLHHGPVFASTFHTPGDPNDSPYTYARSHNPTWTHLEDTLALIESAPGIEAKVRVFPSGMAACNAVFAATLRPGDLCVLPTNSYFTARLLLEQYYADMGVRLRHAPTTGMHDPALFEGAKLVWLETPSNPTMDLADIADIAQKTHAAGALLAVDNTTPTALGQQPLALGADFSVASDTKSMTGHSDLLIGHVAVTDPALLEKIDHHRTYTGTCLGPMEAWLAIRSIPTLPLRLDRSCHNALAIAEFLLTRPEVSDVLYPGLPTHPQHALAQRQMRRFGPVLSFTLPSKTAAEKFLEAANLITDTTSFGGINTTAERRARWGHDIIRAGFIRLSAGCEDIEDLIADITQALEASAN